MARSLSVRVGYLPSQDRTSLVAGAFQPDTSTTGLLPGIGLTTYSGPTTITTAGTTISNKEIFDSLTIQAANVTINNCKIRATSGATFVVSAVHSAVTNFTITNCEIFPDVPSHNYNGIQGHHMTVKWNNIHDVVDGVNVFNTNAGNVLSSTVSMNWIHDMSYWSPDANHADNMSHNDGIQIQGGVGPLTIQGNFIDARGYSATTGNFATAPDRGTGTQANGRYAQGQIACIQFTDYPADVYTASTGGNVQVIDNYLYGGYRALAAGSAEGYDIGRWWRNKFDDAQGLRNGGSLSAKQGYTIIMDALTTCDTGDGTANANVYLADGSEVTVRRNG